MPGTRRSKPISPASPRSAVPSTAPTRREQRALQAQARQEGPGEEDEQADPEVAPEQPDVEPESVRSRSGTG